MKKLSVIVALVIVPPEWYLFLSDCYLFNMFCLYILKLLDKNYAVCQKVDNSLI